MDLKAIAKKIKLLVLDVDGVLTDGKLFFSKEGEELKVFHVHDGLGIKRLQASGVVVAVISARESPMVSLRMKNLGTQYVYQGQENKILPYEELVGRLGLADDEVAYLGDDLPDLPLIRRVGFGAAPSNAILSVKQAAKMVTQKSGGEGAVRELCDFILEAKQCNGAENVK